MGKTTYYHCLIELQGLDERKRFLSLTKPRIGRPVNAK